jgi:hypothetical protein
VVGQEAASVASVAGSSNVKMSGESNTIDNLVNN